MGKTTEARKRLRMKDLERLTGVGRETIRFYIREGLLPEPERPARNVAWYDDRFVERLHLIKELQEKRFLPLSVIKSILGAGERPSVDEVQALVELDGRIFPQMDDTVEVPPETERAVAKRTGVPPEEIRQFEQLGALDVEVRRGERRLDAHGIRVVEHWGKLREAGFGPEVGLGLDRMRVHMDFVRWLAREELRMFSGAITGRVDAGRAAQMAEAGITHVNHILTLVRRKLLLEYIAQGNVPEAPAAEPAPLPKVS